MIEEQTSTAEEKKKFKFRPDSPWMLPMSIILGALIISGSVVYDGYEIVEKLNGAQTTVQNTGQNQQANQNQPSSGTLTGPVKVSIKPDAPFLGNKDAKVTLVEFADYQCPFCEQFYKAVYPELKANYIDTGKIKFVYQDFAFLGPDSLTSAEAAHCANDQGKFWQYHDYLFSHQRQENSGWATVDKQKVFAKAVGLNASKFSQCLTSHQFSQRVQEETNLGKTYAVSGTPTLLIIKNSDTQIDLGTISQQLAARQSIIPLSNGNAYVVGAQAPAAFGQLIDAALK